MTYDVGLKAGRVMNKYKVGKHFTLTIKDNDASLTSPSMRSPKAAAASWSIVGSVAASVVAVSVMGRFLSRATSAVSALPCPDAGCVPSPQSRNVGVWLPVPRHSPVLQNLPTVFITFPMVVDF